MRAKVPLIRIGLGFTVAVLLFAAVELTLQVADVAPVTLLPSPFGGHHDHLPETRPAEDPAWLKGCGTGSPRPCRSKKAGLRIAIYGGSAVEGLPFGLYTAFPAWLERYLVRLFPGKPVEVINYGSAGQAIRHIRWQLPLQLPSLKPDVIIIFSGNNEFWEPAARKKLSPSYSAASERVRHLVWRLSLYRALRKTLIKEERPTEHHVGPPPGGADDKPSIMNEADRQLAADLYRRDLRAIVRYGKRVGVPVLLATVADDLLHLGSPPGPSGLPRNRAHMEKLLKLIREKDRAGITRMLEGGRRREDDNYFFHMVGRLAVKAGYKDLGTEALLEAEYLDPTPQRSNRLLRDVVRQVAADTEAPLCDAGVLLNAHGKHGVAGPDLFFDWCHPNPRGHQLLGQIFTRCLVKAGLITTSEERMQQVFKSVPLRQGDPHRLDRWPGLFVTSEPGDNEKLKCGGFSEEAAAHSCKGHEEFAGRNWERARAQYELALKKGAAVGSIRYTLGVTALHERNAREAVRQVDLAARALPDDVDVQNFKAVLSIR